MPISRTEPSDAPQMTVEQHGQQFATDDLRDRIEAADEGDSVEVDYQLNGLEVSVVGTIDERHDDSSSVDLDIAVSGRPKSAYLHLNQSTDDIYFAPPRREAVGNTKLLLFKIY